ncbi:DUF2171 domain-containing protein [Sphingomonas sp. MMS24-J13]|uniref:DUF2171 domain-containing protein n=1 Tax=Sphingomonas sp. MMS24-J13 TaxID=3238686 RepID=UPI00384B345F
MGYERNDRRFGASNDRSGYGGSGGGYGADRPRYGSFDNRDYRRDDDRGRAYGGDHGRRDYGAGRADDYRERARWDNRDDNGDRGFFDRASDEVRSWFGDDDAERRRQRDERENERDYRSQYGSNSGRGHGDYYGDPGYRSGPGMTGPEFGPIYDAGRRDRAQGQHDHGYRSWRDRQMDAFDRDYDEYRREHQSKFDSEFGQWRQQRAGQRELLSKVQEHQEVVGSDGTHIGEVDHVRGDRILLTKSDQAAGGHHHSIPSAWLQSVDDKITVSKTAEQAKQHWRDEERGERGAFGWRDDDQRGPTNLNRSFSGTY